MHGKRSAAIFFNSNEISSHAFLSYKNILNFEHKREKNPSDRILCLNPMLLKTFYGTHMLDIQLFIN